MISTDVLNFWFSGINDNGPIDKKDPSVKRWFVKDARFDEEIRRRFEGDLVKASRGEYRDWETTAAGRLALVIMLDQFSRNLYRGLPRMYAADPAALELTRRSIKEGMDKNLFLIERVFFYMPLMHAEDARAQEESLEYFGGLLKESHARSSQNTPYFEYTFLYAQKHYEIIARFGRFPHRNAVLNRKSTLQEIEFLKGNPL